MGRRLPGRLRLAVDAAQLPQGPGLLVHLLRRPPAAPLPRPAPNPPGGVPAGARGAVLPTVGRNAVPAHLHPQLLVPLAGRRGLIVGNPVARVRRPHRHPRPAAVAEPHELTDLLAAAGDDGGDVYALVCLLGLNGLRVSEACNAHRHRPGRVALPANAAHSRQGGQARGGGSQPADPAVRRPSRRRSQHRPAAPQRMAPADAAAQRRRDPAPAVLVSRRDGPGHTTRAAALLHHHRTSPRSAPARHATRRPTTPRPTPPSATTSPSTPFTRTPPSSSWPQPPGDSRYTRVAGRGR